MTCSRLEIRQFLRSEIPSDIIVEKIMSYSYPCFRTECFDILHQTFCPLVVEEISSYLEPRICLAMLINGPFILDDSDRGSVKNIFSPDLRIHEIMTTYQSAIKSGMFRQVIICVIISSKKQQREIEWYFYRKLSESLQQFEQDRETLPIRLINIDLDVDYAYRSNAWKKNTNTIFEHSLELIETCAVFSEFIFLVEPGHYINIPNLTDFQNFLIEKHNISIFTVKHRLRVFGDISTYSKCLWRKNQRFNNMHTSQMPVDLIHTSDRETFTIRN